MIHVLYVEKKREIRRDHNSEEEEEIFPNPTSTELLRSRILSERLGFGTVSHRRENLIDMIRERQRTNRTNRNNYVIQTENYI